VQQARVIFRSIIPTEHMRLANVSAGILRARSIEELKLRPRTYRFN
jgi:hypothetical protein